MNLCQRWMLGPAVLVLIGLIASLLKLIYGDQVLGTTAAVPWGILIAGYVFFAAAATGVGLIAGAGSLLSIPGLEKLEQKGNYLALSLLLAGFWLIGIELGNPLHMVYLALSPNWHSGIWWMGMLYSIYLALLLLECYRQAVQRPLHGKPLRIAAMIVKLTAVCNLGAIFGVVATRTFWHGSFLPVYMLVTAIVSGAAALLIMHYFTGSRRNGTVDSTEKSLAAALGIALLATLMLDLWKVYAGLNASDEALRAATGTLVRGPLAFRFWAIELVLGIIAPLAVLLLAKDRRQWYAAAAFLVLMALLPLRLDFILAAQIVPQIIVEGSQPTALHDYFPSWTELSLVLGAAGLCILLYGLSEIYSRNINQSGMAGHVLNSPGQIEANG